MGDEKKKRRIRVRFTFKRVRNQKKEEKIKKTQREKGRKTRKEKARKEIS